MARSGKVLGGMAGQGIRVAIPSDEIHFGRPTAGVDRPDKPHEVGRDGHAGRQLVENSFLHLVELKERIGRKSLEIELLRGIAVVRCAPWRKNFVPVSVNLTPKRGAPRRIKVADRAVLLPEPRAKRHRAGCTVALTRVAGIFVVYVPGGEGGMIAIAFGELANKLRGKSPIGRT